MNIPARQLGADWEGRIVSENTDRAMHGVAEEGIE